MNMGHTQIQRAFLKKNELPQNKVPTKNIAEEMYKKDMTLL